MVAIVQSGAKTDDPVLAPLSRVRDEKLRFAVEIEPDERVSLPIVEIPLSDRRAIQAEAQVA
jgi:hypothetical protein